MTVDSVGSNCAFNVSCRPQQAGLMLLAGVGVLACITSRREFLMDALGKQLFGFMFPNQSVRSKQGVQRYWLISWSEGTFFSDKNVSKLSGNRCHVTGRNRRDRNLLFGLVKGNNFTFIFLQVMLPELAACRRGTLGSHTFLWKLWLWEWSALWHCPCNGNKIWVKRGFNSTQL